MDSVLTGVRPRVTTGDAVRIAAETFDIEARAATDLGSERDRTFALLGGDGQPIAILKVSNPSEDPEVLDMEAEAALHIAAVDPDLGVALPWRAAATGAPGTAQPGDDPALLRAEWSDGEVAHWVRAYDVLPGHSRIEAADLSDGALIAWGETTARLALALRAFSHPRARRTMLWDVQHALASRALLEHIRDADERALVTRVLNEFERTVTPAWPRLRAQVVHTDLTVDNTLTDDAGLITGIIDFGDMSHSALITDLASVLDSLGVGRDGSELFRLARLVLDGYQRQIELEEVELRVLGAAWAARSAVTIAISSWRVSQDLETQEFAERFNGPCRRMLESMEATGWDELAAAARRCPGLPAGPVVGGATRRGVRPRRRPAVLRRADPGGQRRGRLDHRFRRPALSRRLQQRPLRRARPSSRDHGHRAPEPPDQHAHALSPPRRHRARRAPGGDLPAGARHSTACQLRLGGQRSGLADGDRGHRTCGRALHRMGVSRDHPGHRGAVAGGLV